MLKKMSFLFLMALIGLLALSACGGADEPASDGGNQATNGNEEQPATGDDSAPATTERVRLADDYNDALSPQAQLALGSLQLEESDLAIDEAAAVELLPLWQALQSLSNSETAAKVELEAVVNQIQDSMTSEQIAAIAEMKLTEESLATLIEEGNLAFGRGALRGGTGGEGGEGGLRGFGGGLPGGLPGGGPGGLPGAGSGGGFGGGPGGGNLSEDDRATRLAEFAEGDFGDVQDRLLVGTVVRTLQEKTGTAPERTGSFDAVFTVISEETGLSVEEIQAQTADGATLAEIIEANGGDLEAVTTLLIDAFNELPNAQELDVEQMAADWLGLPAGAE